MVFSSYSYIIFLAVTVAVYWIIPEKARKYFLLLASYIFYCFWDIKLIFLLISITLYNYYYAKYLINHKNKFNLTFGIILNLLPLIYYKYLPFISGNFFFLLPVFRDAIDIPKLILPLGISFFTFQAICYQIEVYGGFPGNKTLLDFSIYIAMWPKLLAGPIVRPEELDDQLSEGKIFIKADYREGCQRILQGLFKKIVIADNLAPIVNLVFLPTHNSLGWIDCCLGTAAFGLQVYFDFSGYSDIAIGSARLLGYRFPENFDYPYRAVSFSDFWTKWHITLSMWIRDYIYLPLAMKFGKIKKSIYVVTIFSMIIMGFWHGANWTFCLWGIWHGLLILFQNTIGKSLFFRTEGSRKVIAMIITCIGVNIGWLFFRAESIGHIIKMMQSIFMLEGGLEPIILQKKEILLILFYITVLIAWMFLLPSFEKYRKKYVYMKYSTAWLQTIYNVIIIFSLVIMERNTESFIYFKF